MSSDVQDSRNSCLRPVVTRERARAVHETKSHASRPGSPHVTRHSANCYGSLTPVHALSGAIACVASRASSNFQGFVTALEQTGYRIDFMGGWRAHGSCRLCNMHPRGLAIDINQTGRNRVTHQFPSGVTALAARYGLLHGAVWSNADTGHFELMSESPTYAAYASELDGYRRDRGHRVAGLNVRRAVVSTAGAAPQETSQ